MLVLPNAWDVASARVFESIDGCRAIATASAAIAPSLGYTDHEGTPREVMLAAVERIAHAVELPVTADLEAGYGDPEATAEGAIEAGAVGLNFEDGTNRPKDPLVPTEIHADRVAAMRAVADRMGVPLVINARTDVYLARDGEPDSRLEIAADRGRAYLEAGADCVFVPGVRDRETLAELARRIAGPVSVLATAETPPPDELERLGIARVSIGPFAFRAALALVERIGRDLFERGVYP
jgi:2-methylisocitrate lyase-like PEP mutase family enzyme